MRRRGKVLVVAVLVLVIFLVGFVLWLNRPKPPYQHVPFFTQNFVGFPSELVIERTEGEFDNSTMALASYVSNDEAFVGIKIWNLDFNIFPINDNQWFDFENLEVLAFTKKGDLELRELVLHAKVSAKGDTVWGVSYENLYNLEFVDRDQNGDVILVLHGVGYSNKTGFKTDGMYEINRPSSSSLHELTLTVTLSYARGPFGLYGTSKVSTSLKITVKQ